MKNPIVPHAVVADTALTGLAITAVEFLCYKEFCDMFYKKITARNLAAMYPGSADYMLATAKAESKRNVTVSRVTHFTFLMI